MKREYWFARRFPLGDPRSAFGPVHWKGWAMSGMFVLALFAGGVGFAWFGAQDQMMEGIAIFLVVAMVATAWFLLLVKANSDSVHTIEDYKKGRVRA